MGISLAVERQRLAVRVEDADFRARSGDAADGGDGLAFIFGLGLEGCGAGLRHGGHDLEIVACRQQICQQRRLARDRFCAAGENGTLPASITAPTRETRASFSMSPTSPSDTSMAL